MLKYMYSAVIALLFTMSVQAQHKHETNIWVDGACGHCEERIEKVANKVRGVLQAEWDKETKMLHLKVNDKFKEANLHYKVAAVGHDTKKMLAPDPVYNALPGCCKYRDIDTHEEHEDDGAGGNHNEHEGDACTGDHSDEEHEGDACGGSHDEHEGHTAVEQERKELHENKEWEGDAEHDHGSGEEAGSVYGRVVERDGERVEALPGANVYWSGTNAGVISDEDGKFQIKIPEGVHYLVVSYVGYGKDSLHIHEQSTIEMEFNKARALEEVKVIYRVAAMTFDLGNPFNMHEMHEKELLKCACCNLSESFETNPAVDVSITDAVTGTKQIEMLGLAGQYVQITRENMPHIRGLSSIYGLSYVPGSWIEGIQLNTGVGSVVNGFESITGQINVEMKKPDNKDKVYLNLFGSRDGMMEANLNLSHKLSDHLSTSMLLHGKYQPFKFDHNGDSFLDHPLQQNGIFMHRWTYINDEGLNVVFGLKGTFAETLSGQVEFDHEADASSQSAWGSGINLERWEAFLKVGKVFPERPYSSLGFQISAMVHDQEAYFGRRSYDAMQQSLYSNIIYMGILGNTNHQYRTGLSFQADKYDEALLSTSYLRNELVPGAFMEYTYNHLDKFTVVSGVRADYHNHFGWFMTPRLHLSYMPMETFVLKGMIGRGQKTANIFAENIGMFASARNIIIEATDNGASYGFNPEIAWNSGVSVGQEFQLADKEGLLKVDYYYTWFENQIIANYDRSVDAVYIQSLNGRSFSSSLQAQLNYELFRNYDIRLAYRHNDVKSTIDGELLQEALTPKHRAFFNMAWEPGADWALDMTVTWQGMKRLPSTLANPEEFQLEAWSPDFFMWNGQVSKSLFEKKLDLYLGLENILDYKQDQPIIDAQNPFGDYFDASMIWGPVFGRKIYAGLRLRIGG